MCECEKEIVVMFCEFYLDGLFLGVMYLFIGMEFGVEVCLEMGFEISFVGMVIYKKLMEFWVVVKEVFFDCFLVEIDVLYLSFYFKCG